MAAFHPQTQIRPQHEQSCFGHPSTAPLPETEAPGAAAATLLVRHLPEAIPHDLLSRLFSHYGASSVRPCTGGKMRNCAFVDFMDEVMASQAQSQLNRLRFLGKMLSVERAGKLSDGRNQQDDMRPGKDPSLPPASLLKEAQVPGDLSKGSVAGSVLVPESIAPKLGVDYPFPRHLEYAYPPPDGNILTNIVNALIAVPRFYTQVLHLMNKMNIPAPFRMALPTPPLPTSVPHPPPPPPPPPLPPQTTAVKPNVTDLSSDESEMESSDEGDGDENNKKGRKRTRREAIVGPAVNKTVAHEAVGVKPATLVPKEIRGIKKKHPVLQIKITPKLAPNEEMDDGCSMKEPNNLTNEGLEPKPFATPEEIERGKLPPEEILSLPMFKNYTAGNPTTVLYIKNLAKDVVLDDFYYIFGSLFGSLEKAKTDMNVKLMQEGRMRGQAFVTFPSTDVAHHALNQVNGYVFKGKPMIIQFGRNPAAAKTN